MKVFMDLTVLDCPFCLYPLKPPVYECKEGHLAYADFHGEWCEKCEHGGGFDVHNMTMDAILCPARMKCQHEGCGLYVTYHNDDHQQRVCPLAPCKCPVPGYDYEGSPPALPHHLSIVHLMPVHMIQYSKVLQLEMLVSDPWCLLFVEEDDHVFLVVGGALGMGAPIIVSVVCIRAGVSPPPRYGQGVGEWATEGANNRTSAVQVELEVTSTKEPVAVAVEELTTLTVPPKLLAGAWSSRTVSLHIRIHKLTS